MCELVVYEVNSRVKQQEEGAGKREKDRENAQAEGR